ncbi:MAG: hypothetical protein Q9M17_08065 [Mariprofundus sp.]|nr:hypothetical protein [Mariprofundus sp.]
MVEEAALESQLARCDMALKSFSRCMKKREWNKVGEQSDHISHELDQLRLILVDHPNVDDLLAAQIKYLDIKLRRLQRQLSVHIGSVKENIATLDGGISQADAAKALLQQ